MPYKDIEKARLANRKSYEKHKEIRLAKMREKYRQNASDIALKKNSQRRSLLKGKSRLKPGELSRKLLESDDICIYCGDKTGSNINNGWDHMLPLSRGGVHDISNLVRCCKTCNKSKGNKTVAEWMRMKSIQ